VQEEPPVEAELQTVADEEPAVREEAQEPIVEEAAVDATDSCNLCHDPNCPRRKGDPRNTCLHYGKNDKEDESI
jgi:hypothetical protein